MENKKGDDLGVVGGDSYQRGRAELVVWREQRGFGRLNGLNSLFGVRGTVDCLAT